MDVKELDFKDSVEYAMKHKTKLVWLGREPVDYIRQLLSLSDKEMIYADAQMLMGIDARGASAFGNHVFVCYHGNTSRRVASHIKEKFGVEALSMKGGVTAVVGEIF